MKLVARLEQSAPIPLAADIVCDSGELLALVGQDLKLTLHLCPGVRLTEILNDPARNLSPAEQDWVFGEALPPGLTLRDRGDA